MKKIIKNNWRLFVLIILVGLSVWVLLGGAEETELEDESIGGQAEGATALRFGLELSGGTRIRAPLHGYVADGIIFETAIETAQLERDIASELGVEPVDVNAFANFEAEVEDSGEIEVVEPSVTREEFERALRSQNIEYSTIQPGVSDTTRSETVAVINDKVNEAGLGGGSARSLISSSGQYFILVEVPDVERDDVVEILQSRGVVQVSAYYPVFEDGELRYETIPSVLEQSDFQRIGTPQQGSSEGPHVPVVLRESSAQSFIDATLEAGLTDAPGQCFYRETPEDTGPCLLTTVDGEVVYSAGLSPSFAETLLGGAWQQDGSFILQTRDFTEAQELALHLRAGSLPAELDFDSGTSTFVSPNQGERFKTASLFVALLAGLAVALKVYVKYRDIRVVVPMVATAATEVVLLLGLAAYLKYPIDLAVVGGLIAVIGTGIDDLIIITNEILTKGEVTSERVFTTRYNKAYWIIGAAALTTTIALSPLLVLSLGDLQGFAIFTIIGIAIGVGITRPAYGGILRVIIIKKR